MNATARKFFVHNHVKPSAPIAEYLTSERPKSARFPDRGYLTLAGLLILTVWNLNVKGDERFIMMVLKST